MEDLKKDETTAYSHLSTLPAFQTREGHHASFPTWANLPKNKTEKTLVTGIEIVYDQRAASPAWCGEQQQTVWRLLFGPYHAPGHDGASCTLCDQCDEVSGKEEVTAIALHPTGCGRQGEASGWTAYRPGPPLAGKVENMNALLDRKLGGIIMTCYSPFIRILPRCSLQMRSYIHHIFKNQRTVAARPGVENPNCLS